MLTHLFRFLILSVTVIVMFAAAGCGGGQSPLVSDLPSDGSVVRELACPPVNPCDLLFNSSYHVTCTGGILSGLDYWVNGKVLIQDPDCNASPTNVTVTFTWTGPSGNTNFVMPGVKNGNCYTGQTYYEQELSPYNTLKTWNSFELKTTPLYGGKTKVTGWYHQKQVYELKRAPGPPQVINEVNWHAIVTGTT